MFATDTRAAYDEVARVYAPVAAVVFVLVVGAIGFLVLRGRRRARGGGADERPVAETIYVALLAVVIAGLVFVTFGAQADVEATTTQRGLPVRVTAAKWNWRFSYPGTRAVSEGHPGAPAQLFVPAGRPVRFTATSLDVVHAFWIPDRRFQRTLIPGRVASFTLVFPHVGVLRTSTCSFYCGLGHADMRFEVRVLAPADFDAWLRGGAA